MKRIFIALMVAMTFCSLAMAQNQTITQNNNDSSDSTFVAEYTDIVDSSTVDTDYQSSSFDFGNEFPFNMGKGAINGGILTGLIVVILIFGFPFFIVFVAFYFRYKNRKAKYKLMEQALATGQPCRKESSKIACHRTTGRKASRTSVPESDCSSSFGPSQTNSA